LRVPALAFLALLALAACVAPAEHCVGLRGQPSLMVELYFGRNVQGRGPVTDAEWRDFAAGVIAREFPDGFTVLDADGQWRDPKDGRTVSERTKLVVVAAPRAPATFAKIDTVVDAYKRAFAQQSVGQVVRDACTTF
jgi:hypothetical protein